MADTREKFPLFPLGIVLLPGETVPLHIFEERYKTMIGECLETGGEFGIVWLSDERLHDVGCSARITQVLDRFEDGGMNILVTGAHPIRLLRRVDELPYPAGDIELLDLDTGADPARAAEARAAYADLVERVTDERPEDEALSEMDAFAMAATIEFEPAEKQRLLELAAEDDRLRSVTALFRTTVKRIDATEHSAEVAKSNGHIRR